MRDVPAIRNALNQAVGRHHLGVGALALVLSLLLHATAWVRLETVPIRTYQPPAERPRFVSIEMMDVQTEIPPPVEDVVRPDVNRPDVLFPAADESETIWSEVSPPPAPVLPLPEPPVSELPPSGLDREGVSPVRQDVIAIADPKFDDEVIALPRQWIEKDISRIDQAPDIQLPVTLETGATTGNLFDPAAAVSWRELEVEGSPDWLMTMQGRGGSAGASSFSNAPIPPSRISGAGLDERPEEISQLQGMDELLQIRVSGHPAPDGYLYFELRIEPVTDSSLFVQPRDILFVQDSSGSMTPQKMDECRRGLKRWLDFMNEGDRFDIHAFSDQTRTCFGRWERYSPETRRNAFAFIDRLRADGNTDVFRSLQSALTVQQDPGRTTLLVLITDGRPTVGVTGSSDIVEGITRDNRGLTSIFSIGGGNKVNSFFLDLLSYRNRGEALVVRGQEEIPTAMETWAAQLRRPVLTDLTYSFSKIDSTEIYPKQLTHLFLDRPLVLHGRIPETQDSVVFQVVGRTGSDWRDFLFVLPREQFSRGNADLARAWAWQKVYHMIGDYLSRPTPERLEAIRSFSDQHQLIVPYGFSRAMPRRM